MIGVVRVRGLIGRDKGTENTLRRLGLYKVNYGSIMQDNVSVRGMLNKVKDYITWGDLNEETIKLLGKKKFYRLSPPKKGYGRKGIKKPFSTGGALGNRKEKINDLIKRMI